MMTPEERYRRDPVFHRLVDLMLAQLRECNMTATEIREAAIFAAQLHEMTTVRHILTDSWPARPSTDGK